MFGLPPGLFEVDHEKPQEPMPMDRDPLGYFAAPSEFWQLTADGRARAAKQKEDGKKALRNVRDG